MNSIKITISFSKGFLSILSKVLFSQIFILVLLVDVVSAQVQTPLQFPISTNSPNISSTQNISAKVTVLKLDSQDTTNKTTNLQEILKDLGNVGNLISQELGNGNFESFFDEEKEIPIGSQQEISYDISDSSKFRVRVLEVDPDSQSLSIESNLETNKDGKLLNVVRAIGKVKVGEYLLYKNLEFDNALHHLILLIKAKDGNNNQGDNKEEKSQNEEGEKSEEGENSDISEPKNEDKKENKEANESRDEGEKNDKDKNDKNIMLLLQSLEEADKQEQKEMLNQRERIELPEQWW